jgi:hypothetical protein
MPYRSIELSHHLPHQGTVQTLELGDKNARNATSLLISRNHTPKEGLYSALQSSDLHGPVTVLP